MSAPTTLPAQRIFAAVLFGVYLAEFAREIPGSSGGDRMLKAIGLVLLDCSPEQAVVAKLVLEDLRHLIGACDHDTVH